MTIYEHTADNQEHINIWSGKKGPMVILIVDANKITVVKGT